MMTEQKLITSLRVLFLASEADPIVKVGGLGDVAGSLPLALRSLSDMLDVRLVIPFHGQIRRQGHPASKLCVFTIPYRSEKIRRKLKRTNSNLPPNRKVEVEVYASDLKGVPVYLIAGDFIPPEAPVYSPEPGVDNMKYSFFSLASLELARRLDWVPDILHANDWHTALAVYAVSLRRNADAFYRNTATVLGLHNLPYLGSNASKALSAFGLPPASDSLLPQWAWDVPLPLGLLGADHIVAVSPSYACEILTQEFGAGLQDFLHQREADISGILNGLDTESWNPQTDQALDERYDSQKLEKRGINKTALQSELGLEQNPHVPLLAMITRFDRQKGIDLIPEAFHLLEYASINGDRSWQAVILGMGDPELEKAICDLQAAFPRQMRAVARFDAPLSRRIYAGADVFLIPSRYEPCGLTQMIAMRYGCVPIASATGGLKDTVVDFDQSKDSVGFLMDKATPEALVVALGRALTVYGNREAWQGIQHRGMSRDFSWARSARQYLDLYSDLSSRRNEL